VNPTFMEAVDQAVRQHGQQFVRKSAASKEDSYTNRWTGLTVKQIFKDVGHEVDYETFYGQFSDWHHWTAGGVRSALVHEGSDTIYRPTSPQVAVSSLVNAIRALVATMIIAEKFFDAGLEAKLEEFQRAYLESRERFTDEAIRSRERAQAA